MNESVETSNPSRIRGLAVEAETLRTKGVYSEAIHRFDDVIHDEPDNAWAYAHRGAARAAILDLGDLTRDGELVGGAIQDFEKAIELRGDKPYAWALAHRGEAYRLYAQYHIFKAGGVHDLYILDLLERAYDSFQEALKLQGKYPWASAHAGATCTYQYLIARLIKGDNSGVRFAERAERHFKEAIEGCPVYPWAFAFKSFLETVRERPENAVKTLGFGLLIDVDHRLEVLEPSSALYNYQGDFRRSVEAGWLRLQQDPFAIVASYFTAVGCHAQLRRRPTCAGLDKAVLEKARTILKHRETLAHTLDAALAYHEDKERGKETLRDALMKLQEHPDLESYLIINLDKTLAPIRSEHPDWFRPKENKDALSALDQDHPETRGEHQ